MNYGFVIDNRKCIGCHACSTVCKSENEVSLGVNRTWVKYVETGAFPNVRRHFQVTRCNHCANPPCARICPVGAMYQRVDGIVEFDSRICIGCKACMQACPYDAIYLDPNHGTAAKCHFCAHRLDVGLEPACVVVCPVHAIVAGDMDDPNAEISGVLAANKVTVRKPEQGTVPKLFYIDGNGATMHPTVTGHAPETFMWADVISSRPHQSGGTDEQMNGGVAEHFVQVTYNAQHKIPWHWPVPAYLVTKGIGAGIFMLFSLGFGVGLFSFDAPSFLVGGFLSLLFMFITTGLLVLDLGRPERFLSIVFRPQSKSWLARGAFLLVGFSTILGLWWLAELGAYQGWLSPALVAGGRPFAMWAGLLLAFGAATYTAFLFGQAEGRDLWQSSLLPVHLVVQALMVGSGVVFALDIAVDVPGALSQTALRVFIGTLIVDLLVTLFGEFGVSHASEVAAKAAHDISHGRYKNYFWWGSIFLGHIVPLGLILIAAVLFSHPILGAAAGLCAIAGLYLFEYAFVMAPQDVPN
ncbi:MAG: 4Fe-4S dicluster domain-containing protein [Anaerolineales bacterium]